MLCPVIIDYASTITGKISNSTITTNLTSASLKSETDRIIRSQKKALRENIYKLFTSDKFLRRFPKMRQVMQLDGPDYQKCVIMMAGIDIELEEIAKLLLANEDSISSLRSKRSEDIIRIFGIKPWMKKK